jgi:hypothetical protein
MRVTPSIVSWSLVESERVLGINGVDISTGRCSYPPIYIVDSN